MNTAANARPDRIVVVDDDARIRDLLRRYLTQEGFEVLLAEDAKALNRLLTRETVHLIVLYLMLPGEDGLSICRRLRAANDVTPIIMLTAKVEDDQVDGLAREQAIERLRVFGEENLESFLREVAAQQVSNAGIIVDDDDPIRAGVCSCVHRFPICNNRDSARLCGRFRAALTSCYK